ncbi:MAG: NADH-quinone oxidoreductase subunit C [Candidatus Dormibacteraeota bacterium]|nr:NADH-quinone oxidoreductase subunit C [Candidatus Dormibacteraeota bacterium]
MSGLVEIAKALGLEVVAGPPGELRAAVDEDEFADVALAIGKRAILGDLFASETKGGAALTAVYSAIGDRGWLLLSTELTAGSFRSLTPRLHAASWYEREIKEMFGLQPEGHPAPIGLRLYGWPADLPPMVADPRQIRAIGEPEPVDTIPQVHGQGVFQLPLGPVRSGPQESGEFLFNSGGEDLVMVSPRLGYKFRAVERLAESRDVEDVVLLAERLAGNSTLSNALAFAHAAERAMGVEPPEAARWSRTLLNELERLHGHLGQLGRVADATGLSVGAAQYALLKDEVLRVCGDLTGHRYLRGSIAIGGLNASLATAGLVHLERSLTPWRRRSQRLATLLEDTATFVDRLDTTAVLPLQYALQHNLVGPIGRSSGGDRDARRDHPYASYGSVDFKVPVESDGDALARVRVLLSETDQSLHILEQLLGSPRDGQVQVHWSAAETVASGLGWAEAPGGETLHFVQVDRFGLVRRWRARPPACVNWHPFAYACTSGNNLTDYPVIEASFGLSHAEFDR